MCVWIDGWYLSFKVDVKLMYCYNLIGLFGLCDNDFSNDFIVSFNVSIIFRNII